MENIRYNHVISRKREGAHYTPKNLSRFVSKQILNYQTINNSLTILDPAIGDGELIVRLLECLPKNNHELLIYGFDINEDSLEIAKYRILQSRPSIKIKLFQQDFLDTILKTNSLFNHADLPTFDIIISNPPYIRTQILGSDKAQEISKNFGLKGRVDIYQAFLLAIHNVLKSNGVAGVIVSNRFLTIKGASKLRSRLLDLYDIKHIWDFGDTKLFEASVLPAVIIMSPRLNQATRKTKFTSIYQTTDIKDIKDINKEDNIFPALEGSASLIRVDDKVFKIKNGFLCYEKCSSESWFIQNSENKHWLKIVKENTWALFKEVGKIRVGVKTCADKIFIRKNWKKEIGYEPELLQPLTTHHVAGRYSKNANNYKKILYPHKNILGKRWAVDLDKYPLSKQYLESNCTILSARKYLLDSNRKWYEVWVPQEPRLWDNPKIIFRDISEKPTFWIDFDKTIVNGDCYWLINEKMTQRKDILWLVLAVANSKFIEDYYDVKFSNKLYSNRRRFMTQYVENFPIPNPESEISKKLISLSKNIFNSNEAKFRFDKEKEVDTLVENAFGLTKKVSR